MNGENFHGSSLWKNISERSQFVGLEKCRKKVGLRILASHFSECIFLFVESSPLTLIHGQSSRGFFYIQQILTGLGMSPCISIVLNATEFPVAHCLMLISVARGPVFTVSRHSVVVRRVSVTFSIVKKTPRPKQLIEEFIGIQSSKGRIHGGGQSQQEQAWQLESETSHGKLQHEGEKNKLKSETGLTEPAPTDTLLPVRPHILNLSKQHH